MWIKICGLTRVDIAREVARLAPDAIGLNFYAQSKRRVTVDIAAEIVSLLPASVTPVGLFVNHSPDEIRAICQRTGLKTIQLHGDETPEIVAELAEFQIIRAFRVGEAGLDHVAADLERYRTLGVTLHKCLIDAAVPGAYGGTGHRAPWEVLKRDWDSTWPPLVLAGGLTPANVSQAIAEVSPAGVDIASGAEASPGVQDLQKVLAFITSARQTPLALPNAVDPRSGTG
ncbi:phosphoribosylanthranilate isomerase [Planctomicrobium piriforme]|uniref:N-(5'-phosphoribosyl)anthranilate isomerase n=1 Tax=Planctomicrobium piriforme TaxID=1576369 RepID=A0A1I3G6C6_9PLAN|nr:phosphoribosylanthranilate isomerase [Planctomicrobium piriforme]SFI18721.1 phosphoribosylanthranilate isomerase [Planctomicrobium piriforme]